MNWWKDSRRKTTETDTNLRSNSAKIKRQTSLIKLVSANNHPSTEVPIKVSKQLSLATTKCPVQIWTGLTDKTLSWQLISFWRDYARGQSAIILKLKPRCKSYGEDRFKYVGRKRTKTTPTQHSSKRSWSSRAITNPETAIHTAPSIHLKHSKVLRRI